jgi:hypothetical protein
MPSSQFGKSAMGTTPRCGECDLERVSVEVEGATDRYQINCFECPACKTVLRLVERRIVERTLH